MTDEKKEKDELKISFSQYSTYKECQHKWYLSYFLRLPGDESQELLFGSCVHSVIEQLLTNKLFQKLYRANPEGTIRDLFKPTLKEKLEKVKDVNLLKTIKNHKLAPMFMFQAEKLITGLDFFNRFKDWDVFEVEHKLDGLVVDENEDCKIVFKGFIDLILHHKHEDRYMILDWKTSGKAWDIIKKEKSKEHFYAQLCLYKNFYSKVKNIPFENIETNFYNLPRNEALNQKIYPAILSKEYTDEFLSEFTSVCYAIHKHKQTLTNFQKIKMTSKTNFCYRCPYNKPDLCNDTDEFQTVTL